MADKQAHFEAKYLGYLPIPGIWGHEFTDPPSYILMKDRAGQEVPTLLLEFSGKELKAAELVIKKGKPQKLKRPPMPLRDITFATRMEPPNDSVVSTIFVGFNQSTGHVVHVHVYVFKSPEYAALFVDRLAGQLNKKDNQARHLKLEADLVKRGSVRPSRLSAPGGPGGSLDRKELQQTDASPRNSKELPPVVLPKAQVRKEEDLTFDPEEFIADAGLADELDPQKDYDDTDLRVADSLASELKKRLHSREKAPMLLPPKDYDTVHRTKGNLVEVNLRRSQNKELVGEGGRPLDSTADLSDVTDKRTSGGGADGSGSDAHRRAQKALAGYMKSDPSRYVFEKPRDRVSGEPPPVMEKPRDRQSADANRSRVPGDNSPLNENGPISPQNGWGSASSSPAGSLKKQSGYHGGNNGHAAVLETASGPHSPRDAPYHGHVENNFDIDEYSRGPPTKAKPQLAQPHPRRLRRYEDGTPNSPLTDSGSTTPRSDTLAPSPRKGEELTRSMPATAFNYLLGAESANDYAPKLAHVSNHKRTGSGT